MSAVTVHRGGRDEWRFNAESERDGLVWFSVGCGSMSGGLFLTPEQAEQIAQTLLTAAGEAAEKLVPVGEAQDSDFGEFEAAAQVGAA